MKEYIEKKDAINLLWLFADETCASVVWDFENLPAQDVVEVVRCKYCQFRKTLMGKGENLECALKTRESALVNLAGFAERFVEGFMTDQCQFCVFGPSQADKCEYYHLPASMRGECCQYWDLFRRLGEGVFDERGNPSPAN